MTNPLDAIARYRIAQSYVDYRWYVKPDSTFSSSYETEAQAECNRLNALAYLESIMEPTDDMIEAGQFEPIVTASGPWITRQEVGRNQWQAMIKAKIEQLKETK